MMEQQLITIVTPSFNQGKYIEETIRSVISQEGDFYLEYLIMDGGSTDNTVEIIKKYERMLKDGGWPVRCLGISYSWASEKDNGQSDAINKGFRKASGDIVAWINSDDTYLPDAISKAVSYLKEHPDVMMVYGEGYEIDEYGNKIKRFHATQSFDLSKLIHVWDYILQPTVFMRKQALYEAGLLDTGLHWCMDWDLWIKIGKKFRVEYLRDFLANSRVYGDTKTSTGGERRFREIRNLMRKHGDKKFPPGYFIYGYECLVSTVEKGYPRIYNFFLRIVLGCFGLVLYKLYLNRKIYNNRGMACRIFREI